MESLARVGGYIIDTPRKQLHEHAVKFPEVAGSIATGVFIDLVRQRRHTTFPAAGQSKAARRDVETTTHPSLREINARTRSYRVSANHSDHVPTRKVAMAITGHKTESIYYLRYDIVSPQDMRNATEKMDKSFEGKESLGTEC